MSPRPQAVRFDVTSEEAAALLEDLASNEEFRREVAENPITALGARGVALPPDLAPEEFFVPDREQIAPEPPCCEPITIPPDKLPFAPCIVGAVLCYLQAAARAGREQTAA